MLAAERHESFIDFINKLFDDVSTFNQTSSGNNQGYVLNNHNASEVYNPSEDTNYSFSIYVQQETKMWDKFNRVLNLGEEWANAEGKGEWQFSTGTKVRVNFNLLDNADDLEAVLDIFEEATGEDKDALRRSFAEEGQASHFCYTVTSPSKQEYYFHQLTGGAGEPVVEDFYCDEELKNDINNALDAILESGDSPTTHNISCDEDTYDQGATLVRIRPTQKKNVLYRILLMRNGDKLVIEEWYRWGQGFIKEEDWTDAHLERDKICFDTSCGPGWELDDGITLLALLNNERDEELEDKYAESVESLEQDGWVTEKEELEIYGPYEVDRITEH
jgi:hypothetical protein